MIQQIDSTTLPNGATVLTEQMPGLRSVTVGIWVRAGARHEPKQLNGVCHFIEHTVFKGTTSGRTALDIAIESDRLGGHFDAYTTHESTGFAMKVVDTNLPQAFDLLADMIVRPRFDAEELEREQKVIIEEMKMVEDTPDELLAELFNNVYFPDHPLGRPIEGTPKTVASFDHKRTRAFHAQAYNSSNLVIAAAGNVEHHQLVELAIRAFAHSTSADAVTSTTAIGDDSTDKLATVSTPVSAAPILVRRKKELEQAHLILAAPWPSARDHTRYAASLLASVLGGGTSSRLWQRVREERGLAYSVGAAASGFTDVGMFQIYAGTSPSQLDELLDLSLAELRRVVRESIGRDELQLAKDQSIASVLLGLESTSARAGSLARQEMVHGRRIPPDEIIRRIEAVTPDDVQQVARTCFTSEQLALGVLGNLNGFQVDRARLEI